MILTKEQIMRLNANLFAEKSREILVELETLLPQLQDKPGDIRLVRTVYRAMAAFRGAGTLFGFDEVASLAEAMMNAFELPRNGDILVSPNLVNLSREAVHQIRTLVAVAVQESATTLASPIPGDFSQEGEEPLSFDMTNLQRLITSLNTL